MDEVERPGPVHGTLVTERFAYDGGRQVTVYLPSVTPEVVVFAGDGHLVPEWASEVEAAALPPTMVVGVHRAEDEEIRLHEYSPTLHPERFAAHEHFFVDEVPRWVRGRFGVALPAARTAVLGVSAGAELALALGLRHPDLYGTVLAASPGAGFRPPPTLPLRLPRTYLVAGTLEPFFLANAALWAAALRDAGADVVMVERVAGHDHVMWREELPRMVDWAF